MTDYRMKLYELITFYKSVKGEAFNYVRLWKMSDLWCQQCSSDHIMINLDTNMNDLANLFLLEDEVRAYDFRESEHTLEVNLSMSIYDFERRVLEGYRALKDLEDYPIRSDFKDLVKSAMRKYKLSGHKVGIRLGLNPLYARQDFFRRLKNDTFSRSELCKLQEVLHLSVTDILNAK